MMIRRLFAAIAAMILSTPFAHAAPRAALLDDPSQHADPELITELEQAVTRAGYDVSRCSFEDICDAHRIAAHHYDLLILPDASRLPAAAADPIVNYLHGGGDLIALRTPAWRRPLIRTETGWVERDTYARESASRPPPNLLVDFAPGTIDSWTRSSRDTEPAARHELVPDGPAPGVPALRVTIPEMRGWDTFGSPALDAPFPDGHSLTVFAAQGGPDTKSLSIEWSENDMSRWIAVIPLTEEWRRYVLRPEDFKFWESVESRRRTQFRPENASMIRFGLAETHTGRDSARHEYWVALVGTATPTPETLVLCEGQAAPVLDTISPAYKFYECGQGSALRRSDFVHERLSEGSFPLPERLLSSHPRPTGAGFDKGRDWRWVPLIEALDGDEYRGTPATLLIHGPGEFTGSVWASYSIGDTGWYRCPEFLRQLEGVANRMREGVFLLDGGSDHYTYFPGQPMTVGLRVVNTSRRRITGLRASVEVLLRSQYGTQQPSTPPDEAWRFDLEPLEEKQFESPCVVEKWPDEGFSLRAHLWLSRTHGNHRLHDNVYNSACVWRPREEKQFVTVRDGDFVLDGKPWRAHGVNYMPSSGIASEDWEYFERWLGERSYDPEIVQRDLEHCRDLGFNAVSIFLYRESMESQNLLDILRHIDRLGMKANLSLRPGTPMDFRWDEMREMIEYYRLAENDTVFAYDLAWEPSFGSHDQRKDWDPDWAAWIVERYGSVENAERDWDYPVPRDGDGRITNPRAHEVDTDGDWRRMTAAYRRFLDFLLHKKYGEARRLVHSIDPNHPVSFRMSECGNPNYRWGGRITYDFAGLASAVDIFEPEAYGRIGDWEKVKPGWFTFEYARWANPGLPMFWAEMGVSVRDPGGWDPSEERLDFQAQYFRDFYRMLIGSGADGVFFWWYPGGYRVGENSDYGIINPDGTDRPVSRVIRDHAAAFLGAPVARPVDHWIEFDRDAHPDGLAGIYEAAKEEFWDAMERGKTPGICTAGTGTTSANCALIAVGNTPCDGTNPPKYLDAAFDLVEFAGSTGWTRIEKGTSVQTADASSPRLRVMLSNIAEAAWLAPRGEPDPGTVVVEIATQAADGALSARRVPIPHDVASRGVLRDLIVPLDGLPEPIPAEVTLRMVAVDRTPFGEPFTFRLEPR